MKRIILCALVAVGTFAAAGQALAKDLKVSNATSPADCRKDATKDATYPTIQSAVTAAGPGDHIKVCPGTYVEQVTIPAGKDKLSLESKGHWQAIIKAPAAMADPGDIVHVAGAKDVKLTDFTISGPLPDSQFCSTFPRSGVRVDSNGSATIEKNHITEIRSTSPALRGCQNGLAIVIGRQFEGQVGQATIKDNTIDLYQKEGVYVDNAGSSAKIDHNTITNPGAVNITAPNGIQIGRGASADVKNNDVNGNVFADPTSALGTGILVFEVNGGVNVQNNDVHGNDLGIETDSGSGVLISDNNVFANRSDGIQLCGVADFLCDPIMNVSVRNNHVYGNLGSGISLIGNASSNTLKNNKVENNGTAGDDTSDGIRVESAATGNTIQGNHLHGNVTHDCHDDSAGSGTGGTANLWLDDHGTTQNRPGLCRH